MSSPELNARAGAVDVSALIDAASFRGLPALVCVFTLLAMVFDGFDIQAIGFAAPQLMQEWSLGRAQLAPIFAAGLVGLAIGALTLGAMGDRYGRRPALMLSLAIISCMSFGTAFASNVTELALWRLATGIGLGGVLPNSTALMMEFAPRRIRSVIVALTVVGVPLGGVLGAEVASQLLDHFSWRALFVVGAALPALLGVAIWMALPESPRFLATRADRAAALASVLQRLTGDNHYVQRYARATVGAVEGQAPASGVSGLLGREFRRDTLLIWLIFLTNIFAVYALFNWLPVVLAAAGLQLATALRVSLIFNLGGVLGALPLALIIGRFGSRSTLIVVAIAAVLSMIVLGVTDLSQVAEGGAVGPSLVLFPMMAIAGLCILGMQVCVYTVAAAAYPTQLRSTGVGWAVAMSRAGAILSSAAGALLSASASPDRTFFLGIATVLVVTLVGVALLQRHLPRQRARRPATPAAARSR